MGKKDFVNIKGCTLECPIEFLKLTGCRIEADAPQGEAEEAVGG